MSQVSDWCQLRPFLESVLYIKETEDENFILSINDFWMKINATIFPVHNYTIENHLTLPTYIYTHINFYHVSELF